MTAYVDDAAIEWKGKPRYHLTADSLAELHAFTASIGVKPCWFHRSSRYPHYDITAPQRGAAIAAGALPVDSRKVLQVAKALRAVSPKAQPKLL